MMLATTSTPIAIHGTSTSAWPTMFYVFGGLSFTFVLISLMIGFISAERLPMKQRVKVLLGAPAFFAAACALFWGFMSTNHRFDTDSTHAVVAYHSGFLSYDEKYVTDSQIISVLTKDFHLKPGEYAPGQPDFTTMVDSSGHASTGCAVRITPSKDERTATITNVVCDNTNTKVFTPVLGSAR